MQIYSLANSSVGSTWQNLMLSLFTTQVRQQKFLVL